MARKADPNREKRRQKKVMEKRRKDAARHKKGTSVLSENAARYQMMASFGRPGKADNFIRNLTYLAELFSTEEDLRALRFDPEKAYAAFDLAADRGPLARLYEAENPLFLPEEDGDFWKAKRKELVPTLLSDELVKTVSAKFNKLLQTKRGFKKEHRAIQAGKLLLDLHTTSLTGSDVEDNTLWELMLNVTLRENRKELPPEPPAAQTPPAADAAPTPPTSEGEKTGE